MEEIDRQLIDLLSTKIRMLMEDHVRAALAIGKEQPGAQAASLQELAQISEQIKVLIEAAQLIAE
jgi:hypothetical protein